jgi:hypothetical protein
MYFINPLADDRPRWMQSSMPSGDWAQTKDVDFPRAEEKPETKPDLDQLMARLASTLLTDDHAAVVIRRLAYSVDHKSELSKYARAHAAQLKILSARLEAYLPRVRAGLIATRIGDEHLPVGELRRLDRESATMLLIRYLIQHATATSNLLSGLGEGLNKRAMEILCQKAAKEKAKLASWLNENTSTLCN